MALGSTRYKSRTSAKFKALRASRVALLPNFPTKAEISYTLDDISLGKVIGHDLVNGRVLTDKKGSYDPHDIKVLPLKQA